MAHIEVEKLCKTINKSIVLEDINLDMSSGKVYGFQGINGSGKTMLMRALIGLIRPTSGKVCIDGKELGKDIDFPENLGALIENPGFIWYQSGFENLHYLARIRNKINDTQVKDVIRQVGLDSDSRKWVGKYSMGMKQRLGIDQAMMENPDILVLDEQMSALDEKGVEEIRQLLLQYKQPGRCILITSHNREDIEILCDEVFEIKSGILQ